MINEEISNQILGLAFKGSKMTASMLKDGIADFLKVTGGAVNKFANYANKKQSLKSYEDKGLQTSDIEITRDNIGDFEHIARKYGIKYNLKEIKDPAHEGEDSRFLVVFKAKDMNVMKKAFVEYTDFEMNKNKDNQKETEKDAKETDRDNETEREGRESERENKHTEKNEKTKNHRNVDERIQDAKEKAQERSGKNRERTRSQDRSSTIR